MKLNAISAFVAACCMGATQPVLGGSITFDVLGKASRVADPGGVTGVAAGDPFSGSLTYDLATPDYTPDPRMGDYLHLAPLGANGVVLSVGQMTVATDPTAIGLWKSAVILAQGSRSSTLAQHTPRASAWAANASTSRPTPSSCTAPARRGSCRSTACRRTSRSLISPIIP